jgi:SPP1 family predicted phage head-tail adaptor
MVNLRNQPDIGSMRCLVTIQEPSSTDDKYGQQTKTWSDFCTTWASINMLAQKQTYTDNQLASVVTHKIVIRYTSKPITAGMRVCLMGKYYLIQAVSDPDGRRTTLQIQAQEVSA